MYLYADTASLTYYYGDYKHELCSRKFRQSKHDFMTQTNGVYTLFDSPHLRINTKLFSDKCIEK